MSKMQNPFGAPGSRQNARVRVDMEAVYGRKAKGIAYWASLSFDPAIFEPNSGVALAPSAFTVLALGFDDDDQDQLEAMGVDIADWEGKAIERLAGFGVLDIWIEEGASDEQAQWLEESGYLDDLVDMELDAQKVLTPESIVRVHS